jgi:hypothetical protein
MSGTIQSSIRELQAGGLDGAEEAFANLASMARHDPQALAAELSTAIRDEHAAGELRTHCLVTLLGLTRIPAPECLDACVDMLQAPRRTGEPLGVLAVLGAAAVIARCNPRALLPDFGVDPGVDPQASPGSLFAPIRAVLSCSSLVLREAGDTATADMVRWLWRDCAALDLMSVADLVGFQIEKSGCEDPIVELFVDLAEQVNVIADQKWYSVQRLEAAGARPAEVERLKLAWRAALVAPECSEVGSEPLPSFDIEPPAPEPRIDEALAMFSYGDEDRVELGRAMLDWMLDEQQPSAALVYWLMVTVDDLPKRRRKSDIDWALTRLGTASRCGSLRGIPSAVLQRWLDAPQLLSSFLTPIALELLSAQHPTVVVRQYIHRAIAFSDERTAEIRLGPLWQAIVEAEPGTVLMIVSRWLAFGFDRCEFILFLIELLAAESRENPALLATMERGLEQTEKTPAVVIEVARDILKLLHEWPEESHP